MSNFIFACSVVLKNVNEQIPPVFFHFQKLEAPAAYGNTTKSPEAREAQKTREIPPGGKFGGNFKK